MPSGLGERAVVVEFRDIESRARDLVMGRENSDRVSRGPGPLIRNQRTLRP